MSGKWGFESGHHEADPSGTATPRSKEVFARLARSGWLVREVERDDGGVNLFARSCGKTGTALDKISPEVFGHSLGLYNEGQLLPGVTVEGAGAGLKFECRNIPREIASVYIEMLIDLGQPIDPR